MSQTCLVFDMDGVLAEVTESYRESVVQTVRHFTGQPVSRVRIQEYKNRGGFNNDWLLSQQICADLGVRVPYESVVKYFCDIFFGPGGDDGLSITRPDLNLGVTSIPLNSLTNFYYLTLVIMGAAIVFCWYFTHTAMGKTVVLMRENEDRMKFLGYNTNISRLILFTFTGAIAGLAGGFYTFHFQFVSISAISIDPNTGALTPIQGSPFASTLGNGPASLTIDPGGKLLFAMTPGSSYSIWCFTIDSTDGHLTAVTSSPFSFTAGTLFSLIDPSGNYLYIGSQDGTAIEAYTYNSLTGAPVIVAGSPFSTGEAPGKMVLSQ